MRILVLSNLPPFVQGGAETQALSLSEPDRCKNLICKYRNTALFLDKTSMKPMFLDLTSNEVQKQCKNIVS